MLRDLIRVASLDAAVINPYNICWKGEKMISNVYNPQSFGYLDLKDRYWSLKHINQNQFAHVYHIWCRSTLPYYIEMDHIQVTADLMLCTGVSVLVSEVDTSNVAKNADRRIVEILSLG